jgi:alpha-ketoglutarate-dependent 2,4-dichlorophenoxyacetate dioxygenase
VRLLYSRVFRGLAEVCPSRQDDWRATLTLSIRQLGHGFAGEVAGVDCRAPLSSGEVAAIHAGMNDYAVLVFRDQKLSDEEQLQFTLHFGTLEETRGGTPGPIHFRTGREARKLGPSIKDFSNIDAAGKPLTTDSRAYLFKLADQLWHSDSSFNAVPASYSLLSGRCVPSWGGNTEFADMRSAYDALDRLKHQIEDLVCLHSNMYSRGKLGLTEFNDEERTVFKPVRQRLVRRHPATGRKSLFLSAHAGEIEGMSIPEGRMLLLDLTEFATREQFVYSHDWRVDDFVMMWDNRSTMHRGRRFDPSEARDIRETRPAGDGPTISQAGS